ncbi:hypothetical protein D3C73_1561740 [compost metagenome]
MLSVRSHEVDQGLRMLDVLAKVDPIRVGLELTVVGAGVNFTTQRIKGGQSL